MSGRLWGAGAAALLCLSVGLVAEVGPAEAEKVGVAAAVNPDAFSSLSGSPQSQLNIGKSIFFNERINTTTSGLVQVLLVDGSTFTVGPGSDLVIDKFVYDPKKKSGEVVASFSKGVMRFVGGKISKNEDGVTIKTPAGALAIRGGMAQGTPTKMSFLFGVSMTWKGHNGKTATVYEPGYTLDLTGGGPNVRPTTPEDTNIFMQALSSNATRFGSGGNVGTPTNPNTFLEASNLQNDADQQINDANFIMVQTAIDEQLKRLATLHDNQGPTPGAGPDPGPDPHPDPDPDPDPDPGPVKLGGTFTGYASGFLQTGENGTGEPEFLLNGKSSVVLDQEANTVTANISIDHNRIVPGQEFLPVDWLRQRVPGLNLIPDRYIPQIILTSETKTFTNFNLGFLGTGDLAYADDDTFAAIGYDGSTSIVRDTSTLGIVKIARFEVPVRIFRQNILVPFGPYEFSFPVSSQRNSFENVSHTGLGFASVPKAPLCQQCNFLKYGFWASDVTYGDLTDKMGGWWVATAPDAIAIAEQLANPDNFMATDPTATYAGTAIGDVANNLNGNGWQRYEASGDLNMNWDFAQRSGDLTISHFDRSVVSGGLTFSGSMCAPGVACGTDGHQFTTPSGNHFGGPLALTNGAEIAQVSQDLSQKLSNLSGFAAGSFVAGPTNFDSNHLPLTGSKPQGVMGNWSVGNDRYKATGIFGGALQTR